MAFPAVQSADTTNGTVTTNSNSWTLTYPANIAAGDLLLLFAAVDGNVGVTLPAGWVVATGAGAPANVTSVVAKKNATGSETGTFSMSLTATEQGGWRIFRITGWHGTLGTTFDNTANSGAVEQVAGGFGGSANCDPPSLNPNNWATEDTLWVASGGFDTSRTVTTYPTNMADLRTADVSGGSNGATLAIAMANSAAASFDPVTFVMSASDESVGFTVGVRPAAPAGPSTSDGWWGAGMGGW